MEYAAITHDGTREFCYATAPDQFVIRIRTKKGDMKQIRLHTRDKYLPLEKEDTRQIWTMEKTASDTFHDYYEVRLQFHTICMRYFFELTDRGGQTSYYGNSLFFDKPIEEVEWMFDCPQNLREEERFEIPAWAAGKVVYQIFPARFASSKAVSEDLWYKAPIEQEDQLGGDLQGIIHHLDYLEDLGVDILYLTPVFESRTTHKYDTVNYYRIDPDLGNQEDLKELTTKAHERGMKVILDGVFNHTSPEFFAFQDICSHQEKSPYKDWYFIEEFPVHPAPRGEKPRYKSFAYYGGMPKLNLKNPQTARYILDVATYWIREYGIDGWRLDVADEIGHPFWKQFRKEIKEVNPDALLIGEVWHYAPDFLEGDEWDTLMNYPFYNGVLAYLHGDISPSIFWQRLEFLKGRLPGQVVGVLWNLIDSHDTPRIRWCIEEDQQQKFAAALQLLLPGMPMIYYGDEVGMTGGPDPDSRRGMYWKEDRQDQTMLAWYKKLIHLRRQYPFVATGTPIKTWSQDEEGLLVLQFQKGEDFYTLLFHGSDQSHSCTSFKGQWDVLSEKSFLGQMEPWSVYLLKESEIFDERNENPG